MKFKRRPINVDAMPWRSSTFMQSCTNVMCSLGSNYTVILDYMAYCFINVIGDIAIHSAVTDNQPDKTSQLKAP